METTKADGTVVQSRTNPYQPGGAYSVAPATFFPEPIEPTKPNISVNEPNWQIRQREYEALRARYHTLRGRYHDLLQDASWGLWVLPGNPIGVYTKDATNALVFFDPNTIERISEVPSLHFSDELIGEVSSFYFSNRIYGDTPHDSFDRPIGDIAMRYLPDEEMLLVWSSQGSTVFARNLATGAWARLADFAPNKFSVHGFVGEGEHEEAPPNGRLIISPSYLWRDSPLKLIKVKWHVIDRKTRTVGDAPHGGTTISLLANSDALGDPMHTSFEFSPNLTHLITEHTTALGIPALGWNTIAGWYTDWERCDGWLWDRPTGKNIAKLKAHTLMVSGVTFSPDGTLVAVASGSRIFLWHVATRKNIKILQHVRITGELDRISIAFSPDGQTIASAGGTPDHVLLWDVATGKKNAAYKSGEDLINIAYSPDGEHFVTGTTSGNAVLWEADTGKNIRTIAAHTGPVKSISWSKDGNFFVTAGGYNGTVRRWNNDGEPAARPHMLELEEFVLAESVSYSPCGTEVAVGTGPTIFIWELGMTDVNRDSTTDMADVEIVSEHFSKNTLGGDVTGDGEVDIVDLVVTMKQSNEGEKQESQKTFKVLPVEEWWDYQHIITYSPDGQTLASIGLSSPPIVWDVATGIRRKSFWYRNAGHGQDIRANSIISYSPDGTTLATGSADGTVHLWDVSQKLLQKGPNEFWDVSHYPDVPTVQYYPDTKSSEPIGAEFTVTLGIADGLPFPITGYEVDLQFDSKVLRYVESTNGDYLPEGTFVVPTIVDENQLKLAAASGSGVNRERGILASVTFEVVSKEPASLKLSNVRLTQGVCLIYPEVKVQKIELQDNTEDQRRTPASDVNGDGTVDIQDLVEVSANLGETGETPADVNRDGDVNVPDLVLVAAALGEEATTPAAHAAVLENFTTTEVAQWIQDTQHANLTDPDFQRGVEVLKNLLTLFVDVNRDGTVNVLDLVQVSANLGETGENHADVNGDGVVNILDLTLVAGAFGETAAAPAAHTTIVENLTATQVAQWIQAAQQANLTDLVFQRGIEVLKNLLTLLVPKETVLLANYPNPFNPETWIPYQLATPADVTLHIHAIDGTLVRTLSLGHKPIGIYQTRTRAAYWDGRNQIGEPVASGVYFYTLTAGDFTATRKMLIRK